MSDDLLITRLTDLCRQFSTDPSNPLAGRYIVADRAGLSEQYLYQIVAKKPMTSGKPRSIGKRARDKLDKAFPNWMASVEAPVNLCQEPAAACYTHPHPLVRQVIALMEATDDAGKGIILMASTQAIEKFRPINQTAA